MDYIFLFKYYSQKIIKITSRILLVMVVLLTAIGLFISLLPKSYNDELKNRIQADKNRKDGFYKLIDKLESSNSIENLYTITIIKSMSCLSVGEMCSNKPEYGQNSFDNSILGSIVNIANTSIKNPPASGTYYVLNKAQDSGFIPNTYASEGIGFASLRSFQSIWNLFRNFTYMIFVIIIIVIGFMIMFRAKLNAQTAISVESALPKIAISLILVTFSFAIAGFMIDLMYISIGVIALVFGGTSNTGGISKILEEFYNNPQIFGGYGNGWALTWSLSNALTQLLPDFIRFIASSIASMLLVEVGGGGLLFLVTKKSQGFFLIYQAFYAALSKTKVSGTPVVGLIAAVAEFVVFCIFSWITSQYGLAILIFILLIFTIIYVIVRITFLILYAYINILLLTILSPLIIAFEAIPGKSTFSTWLKTLVLHLSTFPALTLIILLSRRILELNMADQTSTLWQPPYLGALNPQAFQTLIGASLLFMAPDLIKMFKQMTGIKPMSSDLSIGGLFAGGMAVGGMGMSVLGKAQSFSYMKNLFAKPPPTTKKEGE